MTAEKIHELSNIADIINDAITRSQHCQKRVRCDVPDMTAAKRVLPPGTRFETQNDGAVEAFMMGESNDPLVCAWRILIALESPSSNTSDATHDPELHDGREDINDALEEAIAFTDDHRDTMDSVESAMACLGSVETLSDAVLNLEEIIDGLQIMLKEAKSLHKTLKRSGA